MFICQSNSVWNFTFLESYNVSKSQRSVCLPFRMWHKSFGDVIYFLSCQHFTRCVPGVHSCCCLVYDTSPRKTLSMWPSSGRGRWAEQRAIEGTRWYKEKLAYNVAACLMCRPTCFPKKKKCNPRYFHLVICPVISVVAENKQIINSMPEILTGILIYS